MFGRDFVFYDYQNPEIVPKDMAGSFDLVVADPPFLAEECLQKFAAMAKFLSRGKILLCTGI